MFIFIAEKMSTSLSLSSILFHGMDEGSDYYTLFTPFFHIAP